MPTRYDCTRNLIFTSINNNNLKHPSVSNTLTDFVLFRVIARLLIWLILLMWLAKFGLNNVSGTRRK